MKYVYWFIGDPKAPAWVSLTLATTWALLALLAWRKSGYTFNFVAYCVMAAVRFGMSVAR